MPGPVSLTAKRTSSPSGSIRIVMKPPFGVNLIALPTRFDSTCKSRAESADTVDTLSAISDRSSNDAAVASGRNISIASFMSATTDSSRRSMESVPVSVRRMSSRS